MGEISKIEWTDATFNPWWGCARVSPACRFCYADRDAKRWGHDLWRRNGIRRPMSEGYWQKPLAWNRKAEKAGVSLKVFCASMADVFEDHPQVGPWRDRLFDLIEATPWLTWQLLTKRPENVAAMVPTAWADRWPRNIWLGVSAENQRFADERIPVLAELDGPSVRFLSCEPLLGDLDLSNYLPYRCQTCLGENLVEYVPGAGPDYCDDCIGGFNDKISWVIGGGESGPKARVTHPAWFRNLRDQCDQADVAFLFKQFGEYSPYAPTIADGVSGWDRPPTAWVCLETGKTVRTEADVPDLGDWQGMWRVGKKAAGRILDGDDHSEFPPIWTPHMVGATS